MTAALTRFSTQCAKTLDAFRPQRDAFVGATMTVGLLALTALASLALQGPTKPNLLLGAVSLGFAKFLGGAEGALKVFTTYFPQACELTRSTCKPNPTINPETKVWVGAGKDVRWSQFYNPDLAKAIRDLFNQKKIHTAWDFGCGPDLYSQFLNRQQGLRCSGLDGNPATRTLSNGSAQVQDLAVPFVREKRDCVISLEVGAKIRPEGADPFFNNLDRHANHWIILSWPVPNQKGPHQLNCQPNEYVKKQLSERGWKFDPAATDQLKQASGRIHYWYQDTLMVFSKNQG